MNEIWKDIRGYEEIYQVSNLGRIRSKGFVYSQRSIKGKSFEKYATPKMLSQSYTVEGYLVVSLTKNGKTKQYKSHRIIAEAFIPNPGNKDTVNHINGIKDDNRIENLEWCTPQENTIHAHKTGLCGINGMSKQIARLDNSGNVVEVYESVRQAALSYGKTTDSNLSRVCKKGYGHWNGYHWKYISLSEYKDFKQNHWSH